MAKFLRQVWYMAGWAEEIDGGLSREIIGHRIFLFRSAGDGRPVAMLDRCPHRFAPLSLGRRDGDRIICGYHGLTFAEDGHCVRNPFSDRIPAGSTVQTFAAVERDAIIWIWGGAKEDADESLIPDFSFVPDSPTNRSLHGYTLMQANYEYGTDNLMDLSHIEFVHTGSFAGQGVIFAGEHKVRDEGGMLCSDWWMPGIAPPSMARGHVPDDAVVDHWLDMRWEAPASMRLEVGVCPHDGPRAAGFAVQQAHILTPANADETHYFWSVGRGHDLDDPDIDAGMRQLFGQAFDIEDKPMIEAAYANVRGKDFWAEKPLSLGIDQGGTRARRKLQAMLAREDTQR